MDGYSLHQGCRSNGTLAHNVPWHRCPNCFTFVRPASQHCEEYVYTHIFEGETVHELPLPPNNTASETFLKKFGSDAKGCLDI